MDVLDFFLGLVKSYWWIVLIILLLGGYKLVLRIFGVVIIPNDSIGIVNKKFVIFGSNRTLPDGKIVALNGEAGIQADTLAPGVHYFLWPWQYSIEQEDFVTIKEGMIGIVESRDGIPITAGRVLGTSVSCDSFQNARAFLTNGGERGPQLAVIPPGTYRINTQLFDISEAEQTDIADKMVGIVTTKEGKPLSSGEIAGKEISGHNMFQDAQAFINGGGYKGLQEQVMLAGRYFINPRFATVERISLTEVPIAHVGVIISYVGNDGGDISGADFKHGNLVERGNKGVWATPLDPGKYPINTHTHKVEIVPTANVVLNWANEKSEAHKLDERLSSITVRSSDGFTYNLDVSQIIHIPSVDAPKVIARFGSVANLVTQVLEPTIGNYFRNAAQGSDVIDFLRNRVARQNEARKSIADALDEYNVGAVNTLIGDIVPPEQLMKTLTDRKIAEQEEVTYETQRKAEGVRKELQQARALADTQARVVDAERSVQIAEFNAAATVKKAEGDAQSKTINAKADAEVTNLTGTAEAGKIQAIGNAEADVLKKKGEAINPNNYALIQVADSLSKSQVPIVPSIMAGGGDDGQSGGLVNVLLANLIRDQAEKRSELPAAA